MGNMSHKNQNLNLSLKISAAMPDPVASLPQDLNIDILSGLPAKSICQLRCVSSPWRELLSDPQFIIAHHTSHIHDPEKLILIDSYDNSPHIVDFTVDTDSTSSRRNHGVSRKFFCQTPQYNKWAKVEGSCHGLVLVVVNEENTRVLINPTTSETEKVLASDRRISSSACGFGYDCSNNDFKIVALSRIRRHHKPSVDIYSVKQKSWRSLENSPFDVPSLASGIFLNGAIYWLARDCRTTGPSRSRSVIAAFNLAREKFDDVPLPLPKDLEEDDLFEYFELKVIGGCLAVYTSLGHLWVMKEYGKQDSWEWIRIPSRMGCSFKPICLLSNGEMVFEKNDINEGMDLVLYNNTKGKKRTCRKMVGDGIPVRFGHGTFRESLLSPNFKSDYPLQ